MRGKSLLYGGVEHEGGGIDCSVGVSSKLPNIRSGRKPDRCDPSPYFNATTERKVYLKESRVITREKK